MQVDLPVRGKGELATLADSFTSMLDKLRQRDTALQSRATELEQEVQKRQNTEATLERSEAYKEAMLHTIPDLVFVKDPHGAFVIANLAFEAVYGRSIAEISGKTDFDFLPVELAAYFAQRDQMAIDAGGPTISEAWQHNYKTGEETLYETIKTPIYANDGAVLGLLGIGRDITERRRAQDALQALNDELEARVTLRTQALEKANAELQSAMDMLRTTQNELVQGEKLASLGRMVAGLAHELNTPIGNALTIGTTMGDHTRRLQRDMDSTGLKKSILENYLSATAEGAIVLERSLRHASDLIVSFKQVSADQLSEQRREFDLAQTVEEILATLRPGIRNKPIQLTHNITKGIVLDSYPGLITQVISNLVINATVHAFDHQAQGTICVDASDDGELVSLSITDDGCGIPDDIRPRIFDPFFTTRMGRGGTGLGLSIVHTVVTQSLRGTIRVDKAPAQGSRFVVTIPKSVIEVANSPL
jgi:PAS domain S-box-containing protein